jgi:hypothetical protein
MIPPLSSTESSYNNVPTTLGVPGLIIVQIVEALPHGSTHFLLEANRKAKVQNSLVMAYPRTTRVFAGDTPCTIGVTTIVITSPVSCVLDYVPLSKD